LNEGIPVIGGFGQCFPQWDAELFYRLDLGDYRRLVEPVHEGLIAPNTHTSNYDKQLDAAETI